jgi:threonine/homoserine/homoserine lactone efflux protein
METRRIIFTLFGSFALRRQVLARPRVARWLRRAFAGAFVTLGARLALADC